MPDGFLAGELNKLIGKVQFNRLAEVPLSEIFFEMLGVARKNKVILEANFTTLVIGTVVIEGIVALPGAFWTRFTN
jgi:predicted unusual protein kinase regulating ubiquinone biosynthesis (AarF/ABC1/UbiB family)